MTLNASWLCIQRYIYISFSSEFQCRYYSLQFNSQFNSNSYPIRPFYLEKIWTVDEMPALGAEVNSKPTYRWLGPPHTNSTSPIGIPKLCVTMTAPMNGIRASSPWNRGNWKGRVIWLLGHCDAPLPIHLMSAVWISRLLSDSSPHCSTSLGALDANDPIENKAKTAKNTTKHFIFFFFLLLYLNGEERLISGYLKFRIFRFFLNNWKDWIAFNRTSLYDC